MLRVDFGGSDYEYSTGVAIELDYLAFTKFLFAMAKVKKAHYPLALKRGVFVRVGPRVDLVLY